jgi:hypothetical protein
MFFKLKKPFIKFTSGDQTIHASPHPTYAKRFIPSWFKKLSKHPMGSSRFGLVTVKSCVPFLEATSHGFIIPAWRDFKIICYYPIEFYDSNDVLLASVDMSPVVNPESYIGTVLNEKKPELEGKTDYIVRYYKKSKDLDVAVELDPILIPPSQLDGGEAATVTGQHTPDQVEGSNLLNAFKLSSKIFKFNNPWIVQTSKGYSTLFISPLNRWSEVEIISGVVDTDTYYQHINFPFVWRGKEEGEFTIKKGDPLIQCIPFKRQNFSTTCDKADELKLIRNLAKFSNSRLDSYKNQFWNKGIRK